MRKLETHEIKRLSIDEFKETTKTPLIIILDNLRSQSNIGSIFRTCDAFLVEAIALCGICACPPSREMQKTALGATESVEWKYFPQTKDAVLHYKNHGYHIAALEQTDGSTELAMADFRKHERWAVVIGNEVHGIESEAIALCDQAIEIPQFGTKHSLNVSIAAGIFCWEFFRRIKKPSDI